MFLWLSLVYYARVYVCPIVCVYMFINIVIILCDMWLYVEPFSVLKATYYFRLLV